MQNIRITYISLLFFRLLIVLCYIIVCNILIFSKDSLQIRDGNDENAPLIYDKLCGSTIPYPIISSKNTLLVRFQSVSGGENTNYVINVKNGETKNSTIRRKHY